MFGSICQRIYTFAVVSSIPRGGFFRVPARILFCFIIHMFFFSVIYIVRRVEMFRPDENSYAQQIRVVARV